MPCAQVASTVRLYSCQSRLSLRRLKVYDGVVPQE
jgi:hypothetical protein